MSKEALNLSRAIKSVQGEMEAADWYGQREQATGDEQPRHILEHNRDEEVEHAEQRRCWKDAGRLLRARQPSERAPSASAEPPGCGPYKSGRER
jgi:hypothetical protein